MNYEMIQDNIDASTLAAIYAKTEEERSFNPCGNLCQNGRRKKTSCRRRSLLEEQES